LETLESRRLLSGNGLSFADAVAYPVGRSPDSVASADFNGDGKADIVTADENGKITILLGNGDGTFAKAKSYSDGLTNGPTTLTVADFNNDHSPDLLITNGTPEVSLMLSNRDGTFQAPQIMTLASNVVAALSADFNNDGIPDLVLAETGGNEESQVSVNLLIGVGNGTFHEPIRVFTATSQSGLEIAAAQFTSDGNQDLAISTGQSGVVQVLLGEGNGNFELPAAVSISGVGYSLSTADFSGDGRDDLLVSYSKSGVVTHTGVDVLMSNGDGSFHSSAAVPDYGAMVTTADVNGDGKLDLILASGNSKIPNGGVSFFLGNGDGTFKKQDSSNATTPSNFSADIAPAAVTTGQLDGTGRPSIVLAGLSSTGSAVGVMANYTLGSLANPPGSNPSITLSNGALVATGTSHADAATLSIANGQVTIRIDADRQTFPLASVTSITVALSAGNDSIIVGNNFPAVSIEAGGGNDTIAAYNFNASDTLNGGAGDDSITSDGPHDLINGGAGNDSLTGDGANPTILGGAGDDFITGGTEASSLSGGGGDDTLLAGMGGGTLNGGMGDDSLGGSLFFVPGVSGVLPSGDLNVGPVVFLGGPGNDTITAAENGNDTLRGGGGNDSLTGNNGGDNQLFGGSGNDTIIGAIGSTGSDLIDGGPGSDSIDPGPRDTVL
jgi:Ca2+-binding RTX toxin-like protein